LFFFGALTFASLEGLFSLLAGLTLGPADFLVQCFFLSVLFEISLSGTFHKSFRKSLITLLVRVGGSTTTKIRFVLTGG
jgi:hypothetical protein